MLGSVKVLSNCCRISDFVALSIDLIFRLYDQRDVIVQVVSRDEIKNIVLLTLGAIVICKRTEKTKVSVNKQQFKYR